MNLVARNHATRVEEAIDVLAAELRAVRTPRGRRLAWDEVRRQIEARVFQAQDKKAA